MLPGYDRISSTDFLPTDSIVSEVFMKLWICSPACGKRDLCDMSIWCVTGVFCEPSMLLVYDQYVLCVTGVI